MFFFAGTTIPLETLRGWLGARILGAHALFVHNYIPVTSTGLNFANVGWWTLTVEMTWYLLLPLFSLACLGGRWRIALPLVVAATAVTVGLDLWGPSGQVELAGAPQFLVPPRQERIVLLEGLAAEEHEADLRQVAGDHGEQGRYGVEHRDGIRRDDAR